MAETLLHILHPQLPITMIEDIRHRQVLLQLLNNRFYVPEIRTAINSIVSSNVDEILFFGVHIKWLSSPGGWGRSGSPFVSLRNTAREAAQAGLSAQIESKHWEARMKNTAKRKGGIFASGEWCTLITAQE
jgi:hypothetical protein